MTGMVLVRVAIDLLLFAGGFAAGYWYQGWKDRRYQ